MKMKAAVCYEFGQPLVVEVIKARPSLGDALHIGYPEQAVAVATHLTHRLVVGHHKEEVGAGR